MNSSHDTRPKIRDTQRVYVGLSGGVDSAVSAALLQHAGYDVTGAFIKIWQPEFIECTWREDRLDAMRVCARLGIPYKEIDLSEAYKKEVVEDMLAMYRSGRTPNPDVLCNRSIKFGPFLQWAIEQGADYLATGHYARTHGGTLRRGKDPQKDQSYFLHRLSSKQLERVLFPVGELHKDEVRIHAQRFGLPVAKKPDSQGLCFVGDISLPEFLSRYITLTCGEVRDEEGACIGEHDGAQLYTIGQRHGFRIHHDGAAEIPRYVIATDITANTITVSKVRARTEKVNARVTHMHWIADSTAHSGTFDAQTRYREQPVRAAVEMEGKGIAVSFTQPHVASPGQSLVLYNGEECLGGGEIA